MTVAVTVAFSIIVSTAIFAATTVNLGTANSFGVLAGTGIANTGTTTITGDIGSFATTTITGAPSVIGTNHGGDATTQLAKTDLSTAYGTAAGQPCDVNLTGQDLGGLTLTPVWHIHALHDSPLWSSRLFFL